MSAAKPTGYGETLADLGQERIEAREDREEIDKSIAVCVRRALVAGETMVECARLLKMSRQGLYDLLDRTKGTQ